MKKLLLSATLAFSLISFSQAQTLHKLDIKGLYDEIAAGIDGGTELDAVREGAANKIVLNADRTKGIFTLVSPLGRSIKMDMTNKTFENGEKISVRIETNGAPNTTTYPEARKVYINCPTAGTLKLGAYTATTGRGYTIEKPAGTILFDSEVSLTADEYKVYEYEIVEPGRVEINPNQAIYYGIIEFVEAGGETGVNTAIAAKTVTSVEYYDVTGRKVAENTQGLILKKLSFDDGTTEVVKAIVK